MGRVIRGFFKAASPAELHAYANERKAHNRIRKVEGKPPELLGWRWVADQAFAFLYYAATLTFLYAVFAW